MWIETRANGEGLNGDDRTRHGRGHDPGGSHAIGGSVVISTHRSEEEGVDALTTRTGGVE
jgi:hypothetical protein